MFKNKKVFVTTGPSFYSPEIKTMVEDYFGGICLYCNQDKPEDLEFIASQMDVLLLAGGADIFPGTYGSSITSGKGLSKFDIMRDKREKALIDIAIKQKIPQLWICRGMQLGCIKFGFHLIPNISGTQIVHQPSNDEIKINYEAGEFCHYIKTLPAYNDIYFSDNEGVLSYHHQAIGFYDMEESKGLNVVALANTFHNKKDNVPIVEIVESEKLKIVGCQFHPEIDFRYGNAVSNILLERFKSFLA